MLFSTNTLIERAALAADMHDNYVDNPNWIYWLNVEVKLLIMKITKLGFPWVVTSLSHTADGTGVFSPVEPLAIVAVYRKDSSGRLHKLKYRHFSNRRQVDVADTGDATEFSYNRTITGYVNINFWPVPTSGDYVVDTIPNPNELGIGLLDSEINLPLGWDERVVLGMARRALAKEETVHPTIEHLIAEMDNHIESSVYDYLMAQQNTVLKVYPQDTQTGFIFCY